MGDSSFCNKARRMGLLCFFFLSVFSATSLLEPATGQAQVQNLCSSQVCITATIYSKDPNTIEFSLTSKLAVGWLGLGMGGTASGMAGNDLAICWPNATNTGAIISQRSATRNTTPSVTSSTVAFKVVPQKSGVTSAANHEFTCTYSRPLNLVTSPLTATATSIRVIYAVGLQPVAMDASGDPQKATPQQHTFTGAGSLPIVHKQGSSLEDPNAPKPQPPGNGTTGGNTGNGNNSLDEILAAERLYGKLIQVHGVMMTIVFLLLLPVGASLVRFFGHIHSVFRWHRPVQVFGFLTAIAAFITVIVAYEKAPQPEKHFVSSPHATFGLVIICMLVIQVLIGIFIFHTFDPSRDPALGPTIPTWMHRFWGYAVLICGLVQVNLGMTEYGGWPTGKESVWYGYYVWIAILVVIFLGGSVVKRLRARRQRQEGLYYNQESKHNRSNRGRTDDDQYELQQHGH
ncbi:hypothetical protein BGX28_000518 [Mortierella sp. GBA30]|nr:hypothetical protein BGX28_000518 [Mortierella sp. GBA30]